MEACPGLSCPYTWRSSHHLQRSCLTPNKAWWRADVLKTYSCHDLLIWQTWTCTEPTTSFLTDNFTNNKLFKMNQTNYWTFPTVEGTLLFFFFFLKGQQENSPQYEDDTPPIGALSARKLFPQAHTALPLQEPFRSWTSLWNCAGPHWGPWGLRFSLPLCVYGLEGEADEIKALTSFQFKVSYCNYKPELAALVFRRPVQSCRSISDAIFSYRWLSHCYSAPSPSAFLKIPFPKPHKRLPSSPEVSADLGISCFAQHTGKGAGEEQQLIHDSFQQGSAVEGI